mgnify:CR=1 FL=1|jgi:phytanoyl-CoA hydroxylase
MSDNTSNRMSWPACPEQLSLEQIGDFRENGFLAFNDGLDAQEVEQARENLSRLVRETARHCKATADANQRNLSHPGSDCFVQFEQGVDVASLSDAELELSVRKLAWYCSADPVLDKMSLKHARVRGVLDSLLGPDAIRFQDMALVKPPKIGSIKPWHQDNAYFSVVPLDQIVGVWIALDDATIDNGCMHVIPKGHLDGARKHYHDRDCEIVPDRIDASLAVPIELKAGGILFFYGMLPHQTPPNTTDFRRRALQWHYRGADSVTTSQKDYDAIFAESDGTPASCQAAE